MTNILIIDDEKSIRATLKDILEYEGFGVDAAATGLEGLEMLAKKSTMHFFVTSKCHKWMV